MFPAPAAGPYLIVETQDSVRYACPRPRSPAAPIPTAQDVTSSTHDQGSGPSFHSVPSDLSGEWECIQRREADRDTESGCLEGQVNSSFSSWRCPRLTPEIWHPHSDQQSSPAMTLKEALLKEGGRRGVARSSA